MCGIAGIVNLTQSEPVRERDVRQMLGMIRHRGPDQFGIYLDETVGLGSARLSIIDLKSGQQPIRNEDGTLWIVFNGEIFNYIELRADLLARGHRFATDSDTEVLLHLFEEHGPDCLSQLNGQFAVAIWNNKTKRLFLARDRLGIRPLFYTVCEGRLIFGSEIKTILANRQVPAELDPLVLDQIFTYWSPLSPGSAFRNVRELPPGHFLVCQQDSLDVRRYWRPTFPGATPPSGPAAKSQDAYAEELADLLIDATRIRLRADVPVGAYLSGGLDSSVTAAIVRHCTTNQLDTFSIAFRDERFDESDFQRRMAKVLGTQHQVLAVTHADIGRVFPQVVWHTEVPILRTAPAPMFMLSRLVREHRYKVVLTGEGADEFHGGYDIFKEARLRRFWARQPESRWRPLLFRRLYPDIPEFSKTSSAFLAAFFRKGLTQVDSPYYSHEVRWRNTSRAKRFFSMELAQAIRTAEGNRSQALEPPEDLSAWDPLGRSQYWEIVIFLSQYLLSSQGDRVAMAHSVEGRFPFLDYRVVDFCGRLPANLKLRGLKEKFLLRQTAKRWLPAEIRERPKRPYRAPIHRSFFDQASPDYVRDILSPEKLRQTGLFQPAAVGRLIKKIDEGFPLGETDDMALAGIISTQLVHRQFVEAFERAEPLSASDDVKVCIGPGLNLSPGKPLVPFGPAHRP